MPVMEAGKGRIFNPQTSEWKDLTGPKRGPVAQVRWLTRSENVLAGHLKMRAFQICDGALLNFFVVNPATCSARQGTTHSDMKARRFPGLPVCQSGYVSICLASIDMLSQACPCIRLCAAATSTRASG